ESSERAVDAGSTYQVPTASASRQPQPTLTRLDPRLRGDDEGLGSRLTFLRGLALAAMATQDGCDVKWRRVSGRAAQKPAYRDRLEPVLRSPLQPVHPESPAAPR